MQSFFTFGLKCFELQAQTFGQVARAHTHRLEALQQMQGHLETLFEFFQLLFVVTCQAFGQTAQAIFEVTVVVEVFNQETQGRAIGVAQAQRQRLTVQKGGQRFLLTRQLGGIG